jgi:adenylyltransferase/sulfurtransferase
MTDSHATRVREITPAELKILLARPEPPLLLDVRNPWEAELASIDGSLLIPLPVLPQNIARIPNDRPIAVYCHHGVRSYAAADYLIKSGYDALSLAGGIDRWSAEIDPAIARY